MKFVFTAETSIPVTCKGGHKFVWSIRCGNCVGGQRHEAKGRGTVISVKKTRHQGWRADFGGLLKGNKQCQGPNSNTVPKSMCVNKGRQRQVCQWKTGVRKLLFYIGRDKLAKQRETIGVGKGRGCSRNMEQNILCTVTVWGRTYCVQTQYGAERTVYRHNMGQNVLCTVTVWGRTYCVQLRYGKERTAYSYSMGQNVLFTVIICGRT